MGARILSMYSIMLGLLSYTSPSSTPPFEPSEFRVEVRIPLRDHPTKFGAIQRAFKDDFLEDDFL